MRLEPRRALERSSKVSAKLKTLLRKTGARTYDAIADAGAAILAQYAQRNASLTSETPGYA